MDEASTPESRTIEWLDRHWTNGRVCPICGENSWNVAGPFGMSRVDGGTIILDTYFPMMLVTCKRCVYTIQFSAIGMGVLEPVVGGE